MTKLQQKCSLLVLLSCCSHVAHMLLSCCSHVSSQLVLPVPPVGVGAGHCAVQRCPRDVIQHAGAAAGAATGPQLALHRARRGAQDTQPRRQGHTRL